MSALSIQSSFSLSCSFGAFSCDGTTAALQTIYQCDYSSWVNLGLALSRPVKDCSAKGTDITFRGIVFMMGLLKSKISYTLLTFVLETVY